MSPARPIVCEIETPHSPESLAKRLRGEPGLVLLRSFPRHHAAKIGRPFESADARYSFVTARPFLTFRSVGSRCETTRHGTRNTDHISFGNPWRILDSLMSRFELLDEIDLPFPLGGCFGFWGYDLKNFVEPKLPRGAVNDLELPDCRVGFYDSLAAFDHRLGKTWIISTGLDADGSRCAKRAERQLEFWRIELSAIPSETFPDKSENFERPTSNIQHPMSKRENASAAFDFAARTEFVTAVQRARNYICAGDIYQVNLSHRLTAPWPNLAWDLFENLAAVSPAPFAAFVDCDDFQIASSSPEQFLHLSGSHIQTRPIKGTRPRSTDPARDAQLTYELRTSAKEMAELVMITDLLRNDLGKVCEYGSVQVPDLARLEKFSQIQHLVSTVEGRLRPNVTHFSALASCFPGGSITGAPKFRAMQIIDELEPLARGPYTGALGYLGFNRESQLSIVIRTAICKGGRAHFNVGAGIVADSDPEAEYDETLAKAAGFIAALISGEWTTGNGGINAVGGKPLSSG